MEFYGEQPTVDLTYSDVFLVPRHSAVTSRLDVDLSPRTARPTIPLVSANMNSVTGPRLAATLARGGLGVLPQDMPLQDLDAAIRWVKDQPVRWDTPLVLPPEATVAEAAGLLPARGARDRRRRGTRRSPPHRRRARDRTGDAARNRPSRRAARRPDARTGGVHRRRRRRKRATRVRPPRRRRRGDGLRPAPRPRRRHALAAQRAALDAVPPGGRRRAGSSSRRRSASTATSRRRPGRSPRRVSTSSSSTRRTVTRKECCRRCAPCRTRLGIPIAAGNVVTTEG